MLELILRSTYRRLGRMSPRREAVVHALRYWDSILWESVRCRPILPGTKKLRQLYAKFPVGLVEDHTQMKLTLQLSQPGQLRLSQSGSLRKQAWCAWDMCMLRKMGTGRTDCVCPMPAGQTLWIYQYSWPLNNKGLNCMGPHICRFYCFFQEISLLFSIHSLESAEAQGQLYAMISAIMYSIWDLSICGF